MIQTKLSDGPVTGRKRILGQFVTHNCITINSAGGINAHGGAYGTLSFAIFNWYKILTEVIQLLHLVYQRPSKKL